MPHGAVPLRIAVGLQNHDAITKLRKTTQHKRLSMNFDQPIHFSCGRSTEFCSGFVDVEDMLLSAVIQASDILAHSASDLGIGVAYGPLYVPCSKYYTERPLLFDTVFLALVSSAGIVNWCLPGEACPREAFFVYRTVRDIVATMKVDTALKASEKQPLFSVLLPDLVEQLKPLQRHFGQLRPLN